MATGLCAICAIIAGVLWYTGRQQQPVFVNVSLAAYVAGGSLPAWNAIQTLRLGQLNVDFLMIIAAIGAAFTGDWLEGIVLLFLFSLSGTLEAFAMFRTTRSIEALMQLRPETATLISESGEQTVGIDLLTPGCRVRVRPGERFPVDGDVEDGESWADESTLTGESEPIRKAKGDQVFAGTMNGAGSLVVTMSRAATDSTLQRIVRMVQDAQSQKTPTQRFVESWQQPYVVGVLITAAMVLFGTRYFHHDSWTDAFYHAMVLLVAASPCAVVVGSPAVLLSAIARAGRMGILFKGGIHLEALGRVDTIAFDKTGTVTLGKPSVTEVWAPQSADMARLLSLSAAVEERSEHPLAAPVLQEVDRREIERSTEPMTDFHSHTGLGVHARVGTVWTGIGREGLFESHDLSPPDDLMQNARRIRDAGQTALVIMTDQPGLYGVIGVADKVRPEARATMESLRKLGIRKRVILTGDHERVARRVAEQLEADEIRAGLLPDQKVVELSRLAEGDHTVAMIGDGVNDAPALASADVGIAMGGAGTDVALETADVVLMRDDLRALPLAVWISRQASRRVRQNMVFAFSMIATLVVSTFFQLPLWLGVLGHEGSTVLVVLNGLRILWERVPPLDSES